MHNRMVLAKRVAIESATQVVLFITPAIVLLGWAQGREMSLRFDLYEIASVVMASVIVSGIITYGKSDMRQGGLLITIYTVIALGAIVYPTNAPLFGHQQDLA